MATSGKRQEVEELDGERSLKRSHNSGGCMEDASQHCSLPTEESLLQELSDVTFDVEGEMIPANKACLSFHSPVLHAMFYGSFQEKDCNVITLPGKSADGMRKFVEVIHMGTEISLENVYDILPIAHEYQCHRLLEQCDTFLQGRMFSVLNLAVSGQYNLKRSLEMFIVDACEIDIAELKEDEYFPKVPETVVIEVYDRILRIKKRDIECLTSEKQESEDQLAVILNSLDSLRMKVESLEPYKAKLEEIVIGLKTNTWQHSSHCVSDSQYERKCTCRRRQCQHRLDNLIYSSRKSYVPDENNNTRHFHLNSKYACEECLHQTLWHILECLNKKS